MKFTQQKQNYVQNVLMIDASALRIVVNVLQINVNVHRSIKKNPCGQFDYLIRGESEQQIKDAITNRLQKDEQIRKLALKKYFEFCQCLTDAQKEVLKLKYQYDIAKMNLPSPNDRK